MYGASFEAGITSAMGLVRRSLCVTTWGAYQKVWREWEELLGFVEHEARDYEMCILYWIDRTVRVCRHRVSVDEWLL